MVWNVPGRARGQTRYGQGAGRGRGFDDSFFPFYTLDSLDRRLFDAEDMAAARGKE
jgi:hypothetical protein